MSIRTISTKVDSIVNITDEGYYVLAFNYVAPCIYAIKLLDVTTDEQAHDLLNDWLGVKGNKIDSIINPDDGDTSWIYLSNVTVVQVTNSDDNFCLRSFMLTPLDLLMLRFENLFKPCKAPFNGSYLNFNGDNVVGYDSLSSEMFINGHFYLVGLNICLGSELAVLLLDIDSESKAIELYVKLCNEVVDKEYMSANEVALVYIERNGELKFNYVALKDEEFKETFETFLNTLDNI